MKKLTAMKVCKGGFLLVSDFAIAIILSMALLGIWDEASEGTASDVLTSTDAVEEYLTEEYADYDDVTISAGAETKIDTKNYSQSKLNSYYKSVTGDTVSGTCSEVATLSLIEFYSELEEFFTNSSYQDTFVDILTIALNEGYYTVDDGTQQTKLDSLVTDSFSFYGSSNEGNNDYFNLYSTICEKVDEGVPVLFDITGHTMVACGYVTYTTTYTKSNGKTKTVTDDFVIVNDGWSNDRQYSYFPEALISTNIFTRWEFCITKVVN